MQRLRSIQSLRAVAACAVVFLHTYPPIHSPLGNAGYGAAGVDLFFVISGFIMAQISRERSAGDFLSDRLWRIYPMWWLAVLPWLLIVSRGPAFIASSVTLWPIYGGLHYDPVLKIGWTLSFELVFYAAVAAAIASRAAVPLIAYALLLIAALTMNNALLDFLGSPMGLEFLMGVAVARLPRPPIAALLVPASVFAIAMTSWSMGEAPNTDSLRVLARALQWGIPAAAMLWGTLCLEPIFQNRWFDLPVAIGDASYSIYLFHPLVAYGFDWPWPVRLALAIGLGSAMHLLVERRIMAARKARHPAKVAQTIRGSVKRT